MTSEAYRRYRRGEPMTMQMPNIPEVTDPMTPDEQEEMVTWEGPRRVFDAMIDAYAKYRPATPTSPLRYASSSATASEPEGGEHLHKAAEMLRELDPQETRARIQWGELRRENALFKENYHNASVNAAENFARAEAAESRVRALEEDAKRLDWLAEHAVEVYAAAFDHSAGAFVLYPEAQSELRSAIDQAMKATPYQRGNSALAQYIASRLIENDAARRQQESTTEGSDDGS